MVKKGQPAHIDNVLHSLGWFGKYQKIQFSLMMMASLPTSLHAMSVIFIGRHIDYRCAELPAFQSENATQIQRGDLHLEKYGLYNTSQYTNTNVTIEYGKCSIDVVVNGTAVSSHRCLDGYVYAEPRDRTFVSEWDLVCEREYLSDVSQTLLSLGQAFGASIFTTLSDKYGRKPIYMATHILYLIDAIAQAFVPNFIGLTILKFFCGALQQGVGLTSSLMTVELLPTRWRALNSQLGSVTWALSLLFLCLLSYLTREMNWRYVQLIFSAFSLYVFVQLWVTDETIRWLLANNKKDKAIKILRKAAKTNKADVGKVLELLEETTIPMKSPIVKQGNLQETGQNHLLQDSSDDAETLVANQPSRLSTFYKNKRILMTTIFSSYIWFADSLVYYGLLMASQSFTDSLYLGYTLNVLVEFPACAVFAIGVNRLGRKYLLYLAHIIGGVSLLIAVVLTNTSVAEESAVKIIITCVALLGRFGITIGFTTVWLYTPELYPTNLRNTGFGISSLFARLGGMVAPYARTLGRHLPWAPGAVFTALCILVVFVLKFLPETHGRELPQTVEDMENWFPEKINKDYRVDAATNCKK